MRAARVDINHPAIVQELRAMGISVLSLATIGKGAPDIVCGWGNRNILVEVKSGKGQLNDDQIRFHQNWRGQIMTARSMMDVLRELGIE